MPHKSNATETDKRAPGVPEDQDDELETADDDEEDFEDEDEADDEDSDVDEEDVEEA
jgi:hypothetical protein